MAKAGSTDHTTTATTSHLLVEKHLLEQTDLLHVLKTKIKSPPSPPPPPPANKQTQQQNKQQRQQKQQPQQQQKPQQQQQQQPKQNNNNNNNKNKQQQQHQIKLTPFIQRETTRQLFKVSDEFVLFFLCRQRTNGYGTMTTDKMKRLKALPALCGRCPSIAVRRRVRLEHRTRQRASFQQR